MLIVAVACAGVAGGCSRQPDLTDLHRERAGREAQARTAEADRRRPDRAVRHAAVAQAARPPGRLAGPPEARGGGLRAVLRPVPRGQRRRQGRGGGLPDPEAPRLSPGDLQVHLDDLRLQAAPRGPAPDDPARRPGHVDAVVQPAGPQGPRGGGRLRAGADPPRRARGRAGRRGRGGRRGRSGAGRPRSSRPSSTSGSRPAATSSTRRGRCRNSRRRSSTRGRRRS